MSELALDYGPEWRSYSEEDRLRKSRVGAPLTMRLHDLGVTSYIYARDPRWRKLAAINSRVRQYRRKRLVRVLERVNELCQVYKLPSHACEDAARAVRILAGRTNGGRAHRLEELAMAGILYATAVHGLPQPSIPGDVRRRLLRMLYKHVPFARDVGRTVARWVSRIVGGLGLPPAVELYAMRVYAVYRGRLAGAPPRSAAAALVYVAAKLLDLNITQARIASQVGITDASLRNALKRMRPRVLYRIRLRSGATLEEQWWYAKDSYGLRSPRELASWYSLRGYRSTVHVRDPIIVEIEERREEGHG